MSYQVLARKWRPQRFDEVVGQAGVTQTLRNAIVSERLAQAFVFAGPRGVGKTTTARLLARALNCIEGPTPEPCGTCDACREIAEGRDIDVLEIDAATHTQVENIREVIIAGLAVAPVRNRYKVFLIDEVHQLSNHSFNALLKSIEEPPPHVVFMMATTEVGKIPETILSRSQVFEFKTIATSVIADQLRMIAASEGVTIDEAAIALLARSAEGSMRDAQSAFDQVIAFAGETITDEDVSTVLGIVGRDLVLDIAEAVAEENGPVLFELVRRAVEAGYDLRMVCRELSRVNRDLLVVSLDASRLDDPEIVAGGDRDRTEELARRFSREDLMRAFDVLAHAEADIRTASQPRYHLEMALVRWMHLRQLEPLVEIIERIQSEAPAARPDRRSSRPSAASSGATSSSVGRSDAVARSSRPAGSPPSGAEGERTAKRAVDRSASGPSARPSAAPPPAASSAAPPPAASSAAPPPAASSAAPPPAASSAAPPPAASSAAPAGDAGFKDALLAEIRRTNKLLYGTVLAQARTIQVESDRVTVTFAATQRTLRTQLERKKKWLEDLATKLAGTKVSVVTLEAEAPASAPPVEGSAGDSKDADPKAALKNEAMADAGVQAMLDVFSADIREVEEL